MSTLFKKAAVFTDIHVGMRNNSIQHNNDCKEFVQWMIKEAKKEGCETCIFTGDWHHARNSINVVTLNYTNELIGMLSEAFDKVYMLMGNHDLYYRERRDIYSVPWLDLYDNITVINDKLFLQDDVAIVPWIVGEEWKTLKDIKVKYMFGHFEIPHFKMNAMVEMPDTGEISATDLAGPEKVFSGHFHKRQTKGNITYIGNCFPHNYADVDDNERGMMILEWDTEPVFKAWPDAPKFVATTLSDLLENTEEILTEKTYCKITVDVHLSYEEAAFVKETLIKQYSPRELVFLPQKKHELSADGKEIEQDIRNVDAIVVEQLTSIKSTSFNSATLIDIYNTL